MCSTPKPIGGDPIKTWPAKSMHLPFSMYVNIKTEAEQEERSMSYVVNQRLVAALESWNV